MLWRDKEKLLLQRFRLAMTGSHLRSNQRSWRKTSLPWTLGSA